MDKFAFGRVLVVLVLITQTIASPVSTRSTVTNLVTGWDNRTICLTESCKSTAISILSSMNTDEDPCENFYEYACGNWATQNPIPPGRIQWSQFGIISAKTLSRVKDIVSSPIKWTDIRAVQKAKETYQTCMDEVKIDDAGLGPVEEILRDNGGWPLASSPGTWTEGKISWQTIQENYMRRAIISALFGISVGPNLRNSTQNIIWINKPDGFRLPKPKLIGLEADVYLMHVYTKYIWTIVHAMDGFRNSQVTSPDLIKSVQDMIKFEIQLANATLMYEAVDADDLYNTITISELQQLSDSAGPRTPTAKINWLKTIQNVFANTPEVIITDQERVLISEKDFFIKLVHLLNKTPEETVVNYVHWKMVDKLAYHTTKKIRRNIIDFLNESTGVDNSESRDIFCISQTGFQHAVGYAYVKKYFSEHSKTQAVKLIKRIQGAMAEKINSSSWLDTNTKALANEKLAEMGRLIGYPDWYSSETIDNYYKDLQVGPFHILNVLNRWKFIVREQHKELRLPIDRVKWPVTPTQMNAFYYKPKNAAIFPAAILQIPFYDAERPEAVNYAAIGAIIGHEISHGFDNWGRQYDKNGNNNQWWGDDAVKKYENQTRCFIEQFNKFKIYDSGNETIFADGERSLQENIADTTGFQLAHAAYVQWESEKHEDFTLPKHEKYTDEQLFFLSLANTWCAAESNQYLKKVAPKSDHSVNSLRIIGSLSNIESFGKAFNCTVGTRMNPARKCSVWD